MKLILVVFVLLVLGYGQYANCPGGINEFQLVNETATLGNQVKNGKLYTYPYDGRYFYVVVLNGTAYEMGYAYGQLMQFEIQQVVKGFFQWAANYIANNVTQISKLPKFLRAILGQTGVQLAKGLLDLNYYLTEKYTPKRWNEEMRGLSDATGISIWTFRQLNLLPELLKASCSIMGGYSNATATGNVIHLRALDWEEHAPMSRYATVAIYHPTEKGSVPLANIAWAGFIGTLTGYNAAKIGVGERLKGGPNSDMTRLGTPWTYVLRDMLQFSSTQEQAINYLIDAHRTCTIYLGVGSGSGSGFFNIIEYSKAYLNVYNWTTWHHDGDHPATPDLLWKEYQNPKCFANILLGNYGKINPQLIWKYLAPMAQTGDSQVVTFDYLNDVIYCQYPNPVTFDPGYTRPAILIDLKPYFNPQILE